MKNGAVKSLQDAIASLPETPEGNRIKELLATLVAEGIQDDGSFRLAVEKQFNAVMDRASGWVKRRQQLVALIVSTILVLLANIDTFTFATALSSSPELRAKMLQDAEQLVADEPTMVAAETNSDNIAENLPSTINETSTSSSGLNQSLLPVIGNGQTKPNALNNNHKTGTAAEKPSEDDRTQLQQAVESYLKAKNSLADTGLQFGWKNPPQGVEWFTKVSGLLISIFAISLGAPFWFDLLKRFMQVRQAGVSPREKKG